MPFSGIVHYLIALSISICISENWIKSRSLTVILLIMFVMLPITGLLNYIKKEKKAERCRDEKN